jgi:hypothetical protein
MANDSLMTKRFYAAGFDALVKQWDKWRICREINVFSRFEYLKCYLLYQFVTYLLALSRMCEECRVHECQTRWYI